MKITVSFLSNSFKKVESFIKIGTILGIISLCIFIFCFLIHFIKMPVSIIYLATNLRQAQSISNLNDMAKEVYPVFNPQNYSMIEVAKEDNKGKEQEIFKSQNEAIDSVLYNRDNAAIEASVKNKNMNLYITDYDDSQRISVYDMKITNYSKSRNLNFEELFNKVITLTKLSDKILIYNTHTSESYANSEKFQFPYTGTARTTDANFNTLSTAKEFAKNLSEKSIQVIQDTTPHDYGTYTSAYSKSRVSVQSQIKKNGNYGISIDLHRDAIADINYKPTVNIKGVQVAQCMFVVGANSNSTKNPYFLDNLALALQLQRIADELYPGLFRPMSIRDSIYNQDLNKFSLLVEVGATGNTIEEVRLATRCLTNILNVMYKN